MEEYKGTNQEVEAKGLHVSIKGSHKKVGQSVLMSFKHDKRGRQIPDTEGYENAITFADAINVRQTIPFSLTELKSRYEEAVEGLKNLTSATYKLNSHHNNPKLNSILRDSEDLIKKNNLK
jgi:hypothetical protein